MPKKRKIIPYNPELKEPARELRKNMTLSEVLLWNELKQRNMLGYDFDRQRPIGNCIVDFFCKELSLAIEIDGDTHIFKYDYDEERQRSLEKLGVSFLRFEDIEVKKNMNNVLRVIEDWIKNNKPTPDPSREGNLKEKITPDPSGEGNLKEKITPDPSGEGNYEEELTTTTSEEGNLNMKSTSDSADGNLKRFISTPVYIGSIPLGGNFPVRIQSMTNTNTLDTKASVAQCIRIIEAGADYVRLTAQGIREAQNLANIKKALRRAGFKTPLIADIHFNPETAETAARLVEKVRINPGNYADKRASFSKAELTYSEYLAELERIRNRLMPLIAKCRQYGTVIRVGVNHGSLSDRIMTRYGNTPEGMAISAIEFLEIFRGEGFNDLVVSMKSSDSRVMVESNIMLVKMMIARDMNYPVHLGITEAGEGDDGRIISAAGIGTLLSAGIGDTIRVSLSEDPEREIPVAKEILHFLGGQAERVTNPVSTLSFKNRTNQYKPEVIIHENGSFFTESGKTFHGNMITFNAGMPPFLPEPSEEYLILNPQFSEDNHEKLVIDASALLGRYFILKQADGICITNSGKVQGEKLKELSFSILQATEARITRTRYISCPTCGRTKFNLQDAIKKVKAATSQLKGLKIAIMGCIVNGPGEMAGADYGYVGAAAGKVHIYRGTTPVLKNIPEKKAVEELLKLIAEDQKVN